MAKREVTERGTPVKLIGAWNGSTGMVLGKMTGPHEGLVEVSLGVSRREGYFGGEHVAAKPEELEVLGVIVAGPVGTGAGWSDREAHLQQGLEKAWGALKWKRQNPIDQIDEARDIIDDTLERPRLDGTLGSDPDSFSRVRGMGQRSDGR